ncbi:MAG: hypothetical protein ACREHG_04900, partial [Candidatus Saccharimonadales bacterium]
ARAARQPRRDGSLGGAAGVYQPMGDHHGTGIAARTDIPHYDVLEAQAGRTGDDSDEVAAAFPGRSARLGTAEIARRRPGSRAPGAGNCRPDG